MNENQSLEVVCRECGSTHHVNLRLAGRRVRCPHCDALVDVPVVALHGSAEPVLPASTPVFNQPVAVEPLPVPLAAEYAMAALVEPELDPIEVSEVLEPLEPAEEEEEDEPIPQRPEWHDEELDMTPMVDVTFLLLIFFMVTASFSLQKSIESARQQTEAPSTTSTPEPTEELDMVKVQINEQGTFLVLAPDWERETPGKQNLIRALKEAIGDGSTKMKLVIEVHEAAKLQALVDCMDAATLSDYGEVQVTQVEGFD